MTGKGNLMKDVLNYKLYYIAFVFCITLAIEIVDDDTFLGTDNAFNMFVCTKDGYILRTTFSLRNNK